MEKIGLNEEKSVETLGDIRKWRKGVDREEGLVVWKHSAGWNAKCCEYVPACLPGKKSGNKAPQT